MIVWDLTIPLREVVNALAIATRPCDGERANYASKGNTRGVSSMLKLVLKLDRIRVQNVTGPERKAVISAIPAPSERVDDER